MDTVATNYSFEIENEMRYWNNVVSGSDVIRSMLLAYFHN